MGATRQAVRDRLPWLLARLAAWGVASVRSLLWALLGLSAALVASTPVAGVGRVDGRCWAGRGASGGVRCESVEVGRQRELYGVVGWDWVGDFDCRCAGGRAVGARWLTVERRFRGGFSCCCLACRGVARRSWCGAVELWGRLFFRRFVARLLLLFEFVAADFFEVVDDEDERRVDDLGDEFGNSAFLCGESCFVFGLGVAGFCDSAVLMAAAVRAVRLEPVCAP